MTTYKRWLVLRLMDWCSAALRHHCQRSLLIPFGLYVFADGEAVCAWVEERASVFATAGGLIMELEDEARALELALSTCEPGGPQQASLEVELSETRSRMQDLLAEMEGLAEEAAEHVEAATHEHGGHRSSAERFLADRRHAAAESPGKA